MHGHFTMYSIVAKLILNTNTTPMRAFLNAGPADKRNKKSLKLSNENVQNLQYSETHSTEDGVIYLPRKDT
jgi:hypothetical protein